jgi:hypothetical protein
MNELIKPTCGFVKQIPTHGFSFLSCTIPLVDTHKTGVGFVSYSLPKQQGILDLQNLL